MIRYLKPPKIRRIGTIAVLAGTAYALGLQQFRATTRAENRTLSHFLSVSHAEEVSSATSVLEELPGDNFEDSWNRCASEADAWLRERQLVSLVQHYATRAPQQVLVSIKQLKDSLRMTLERLFWTELLSVDLETGLKIAREEAADGNSEGLRMAMALTSDSQLKWKLTCATYALDAEAQAAADQLLEIVKSRPKTLDISTLRGIVARLPAGLLEDATRTLLETAALEGGCKEFVDWIASRNSLWLRQQFLPIVIREAHIATREEAESLLADVVGWKTDNDIVSEIAESIAIESQDPVAAISFARDCSHGYALGGAIEVVLGRLFQRDPHLGMRAAEEARRHVNVKFETLATRYAEVDPKSALRSLVEMDIGGGSLANVGIEWATQDPLAAIASLKTIENSSQRRVYAQGIAEGLGRENPEAGIEWMRHISKELLDDAHLGFISGFVQADPEGAAQFVGELVDTASGPELATALVSHWSIFDPYAAAAWLSQHGGDLHDPAPVAPLVRQMARMDPLATSEWLGELPYGRMRDTGAQTLVTEMATVAPYEALVWANALEDPVLRVQSTGQLLHRWGRYDLSAAREAFRGMQSSWTSEEAARIESYLNLSDSHNNEKPRFKY